MALLEDFSWAMRQVADDWKNREVKQARDTLPARYTTSNLRHIRIQACRDTAPKMIECAKWSQTDPFAPDPSIPTYPLGMEHEHEGSHLITAEYVCDSCKHPCVTSNDFIDKLGLDIDERTLRRYLNDGDPMPTDQFKRAVGNAWTLGWLGYWQVVTIGMHMEQMQATRRSLLAVLRRAMERKSFRLHKKFDIDHAEVEKELEKQLRILDLENTRDIHEALKNSSWPLEIRDFMAETLTEKLKEKK